MRKYLVVSLAICFYQMSAANAAPRFDVPAECKNLALMQAQLLTTQFHSNQMGEGTYNPSELTLKTNNGLKVSKIDYLGGDSEDTTGPNAGKYPCDTDKDLCTNPADAGGAIDWARLTVVYNGGTPDNEVAEVVVSMGSRGGCTISSAKTPAL